MRIVCVENLDKRLLELYQQLQAEHGNLRWWPADTPFEVALGAILTQATAWRNVEKALDNLKAANAFTPEQIHAISQDELEKLVHPSGYFRMKAKKVRAFVDHIIERPMAVMFEQDVPVLKGITLFTVLVQKLLIQSYSMQRKNPVLLLIPIPID